MHCPKCDQFDKIKAHQKKKLPKKRIKTRNLSKKAKGAPREDKGEGAKLICKEKVSLSNKKRSMFSLENKG